MTEPLLLGTRLKHVFGERVLVIAPHADDETIGCGATIARLTEEGVDVHVRLVCAGDVPFRHEAELVRAELREDEFARAMTVLGVQSFDCLYPKEMPAEMYLDRVPQRDLVNAFEVKGELAIDTLHPTSVLLPLPGYHQDHRAVFQAAFAACRMAGGEIKVSTVLGYEEPNALWSYDVDQQPSLYVDVTRTRQKKIEAMQAHVSQHRDSPLNPFSEDSLALWMEMRGRAIGAQYAEAFRVFRMAV